MANFLQFVHALIFDVSGRFVRVLLVPGPPRAQIRVPRVRAAQNGPVRHVRPSFELILASKWPLFDFKNAIFCRCPKPLLILTESTNPETVSSEDHVSIMMTPAL